MAPGMDRTNADVYDLMDLEDLDNWARVDLCLHPLVEETLAEERRLEHAEAAMERACRRTR